MEQRILVSQGKQLNRLRSTTLPMTSGTGDLRVNEPGHRSSLRPTAYETMTPLRPPADGNRGTVQRPTASQRDNCPDSGPAALPLIRQLTSRYKGTLYWARYPIPSANIYLTPPWDGPRPHKQLARFSEPPLTRRLRGLPGARPGPASMRKSGCSDHDRVPHMHYFHSAVSWLK